MAAGSSFLKAASLKEDNKVPAIFGKSLPFEKYKD